MKYELWNVYETEIFDTGEPIYMSGGELRLRGE